MFKIGEGEKYARGQDGPKEGLLRNHSEPMDSTMTMGGDETKTKTRTAGKEFATPMIPKKVIRIHVDVLFC